MSRSTARLAVAASFAVLLTAACNTDSKDVSALSGPTMSANKTAPAPETPSASAGLGVAGNFTILGRAAVTCTNGTITGNVGDSVAPPAGAITLTTCPLTGGTAHVGDAAARAAYNAFLSAYTALAPKAGDCDAAHTLLSTIPASVTLAPGVYCTDAALTATDVTLTLNGPASATWLFKIGTGGTGALKGTGLNVIMAGGANACNVTWWVSQASTMTDSDLKGTILAGAAITLTRGTLIGRAFSKAGATVTGTAVTGCVGGGANGGGECDHGHGGKGHHPHHPHKKCNQGVGNGREGCDPGNSNHHHSSNDENGGTPGHPGKGGKSW